MTEIETSSNTMLVPIDTYLKAGIHIGTKFKSNYMKDFIYKIRPDGLYVLNLQKIDERIALAANFLSQFKPEEIIVVGRRENAWKPLRLFSKLTGARVFPGRYPPGILTNTALRNFIEAKVMLVVDAWPDRNAIQDAVKAGIPIVALCDTNNTANNIDLVVPCNNKGRKALGLFFYLLARELLLKWGKITSEDQMEIKVEEFLND
ncbi:30S ribosomal protein S2 [Candidatus Woesearchaeota archaeon]|nr:MAG: 30S ribosomal protein S2 [Candidatus Woesearchaeota archaeon]